MKPYLLIIGVLLSCVIRTDGAPATTTETDADRILGRLRDERLAHPPTPAEVSDLLARQTPEGAWPDVVYSSTEMSYWSPVRHIDRLERLAVALASHKPEYGPPEHLRQAVTRGMDYWLKVDPVSKSWWHNTIGLQQHFTNLLVVAREWLSPAETAGAHRIMARSHLDGMTGANKVWEAYNLFMLGAFTNDPALMSRMQAAMTSELRFSADEGFQADWSFYQHGPQPAAGNYGIHLLDFESHLAQSVAGTGQSFSDRDLNFLRDAVQEYQDWVVWQGRMDLSSLGRQLDFINADQAKAQELAGVKDRLASIGIPLKPSPVGSRYFWRSDYAVHRRPHWYASIKTYSSRVLRTETTVNHENQRGYYLCDGFLLMMVDGTEYANIQPVWDWNLLPGVTAPQPAAGFTEVGSTRSVYNQSGFVGGATDGDAGVNTLELVKDGLHIRKSWFALPDGVVCLGSDLSSSAADPVATGVNQCLLKGEATQLSPSAWWHAGLGYWFLAPADVHAVSGPQSGRWVNLRAQLPPSGFATGEIQKQVFKLWINHGVKPTAGTYAYAILPTASVADFKRTMAETPYRIIQNSPAMQAIESKPDGVVAAVCYAPGQVQWTEGADKMSVELDQPGLALVRKTANGWKIVLADPTQKLTAMGVTFRWHQASLHREISLPTATRAGASVTWNVQRDGAQLTSPVAP